MLNERERSYFLGALFDECQRRIQSGFATGRPVWKSNSHPKKSQKIKKYMLKKSLNYGYMNLNEQLTTSHNKNKGIQGIPPSYNGPSIPIFGYVELRRKFRHTVDLPFLFKL